VRRPVADALATAGVGVTPEDAALLAIGVTVVAATVGSLFGPVGAAVLGVVPLASLPWWFRLAAARHRRAVMTAMPGVLEEVARDLRAGGTVATGLQRIAALPGTARVPVEAVLRRLGLGLTLEESLLAWPQDHPDDEGDTVRATATALAVATRVGGRAADALDGLAAALRDRAAVAAEARAQAAQGRLSAVVVASLPVASLAGSLAVGGDAPDVLVGTPTGRLALVAGLTLDGVAAWWMARIVRVQV